MIIIEKNYESYINKFIIFIQYLQISSKYKLFDDSTNFVF